MGNTYLPCQTATWDARGCKVDRYVEQPPSESGFLNLGEA